MGSAAKARKQISWVPGPCPEGINHLSGKPWLHTEYVEKKHGAVYGQGLSSKPASTSAAGVQPGDVAALGIIELAPENWITWNI